MSTFEDTLAGINDPKTLRHKRAARKGNLTRLSNHLLSLRDVSLDQLLPSELITKTASVADNITAYDHIQDRLEAVATPDDVASEEADILEQRRLNGELLDNYNVLSDVASAWATGDRLLDVAQDLTQIKDIAGTYARKSYEQLMSDFKEYRHTIKRHKSYKELHVMKDKLEPAIRDLSERIDKELNDAASISASSLSPHHDSSVSASRPFHSKLRLQLPHFSGDLLKWRDFWSLFSAVIEGEKLTDQEKICHLQAAMKTEEAQAVVRHASSKGSYDDAVTALRKRYDKTRVVYAHHVNALTSRSPIKSTCEDLVRALQELDLHYGGLATHLGDTLSQFITAATVQLMDTSCATHWADYTSTKEEPPDMDTLRAYFEHRIATLQANPHLRMKPVQPPSQTSRIKDKPRTVVHQIRETSSSDPHCPACGDSHNIYQCPNFRSMTVGKRYSLTQSKHLCHNCLGQGHTKDNCKSKHSCRECSARHHTWLHKPASPQPTDQSAQKQDSNLYVARGRTVQRRSTQVFPMTALVTATSGCHQQRARAFLDTGATITLITSRLANSLRAPRSRSNTNISGIAGRLTSDYTVDVKLSSAFTSSDKSIHITAHIIESIMSDSPVCDREKVKQMPFLKGLQLADPDLGSHGKIDLLLGLPDFIRCKEDQSVSSPTRCLTAEKTLFGWAVGGSIEGYDPSDLCLVAAILGQAS